MNAPIDDHSHRSALPVPARSGFTGVLRRYPWAPALLVLTVVLLWFVSRFYSPQTGFTSMLTIGDQLTPSRALREQHPYVFKDSCGYDGQAYVQIALDPLLRSPDLVTSVDSLGYRARRIFMPACAWLAGLGRPAWVVQAYALSNVAGWLLLGLVLLRWLPPDSPGNVFRWAGILFSHGLCTSLRCSLTDGPGLALLALGLLMLETGRLRGAIATFAATILSRETYVLNIAAALTPERFRDRRAWLRAARLIALATLPLLLWIVYVRLATGAPRAAGSRNFALPAFGYFRRWHELLSGSNGEQYLLDFRIVGILSQVALTVQVLFLFLRPRFGNAWWRAGAASAALGLVLGPAVWEGFPGSALRVLLPVTVAFNLLVPKGRKWLPILILGNLTILGGLGELRDAPIYFAQWQVERGAVYSTVMDTGSGWYPPEADRDHVWRWCADSGQFVFTNRGDSPVSLFLSGKLSALSPRVISIEHDGVVIWRSARIDHIVPFRTTPITIPPGVTTFVVSSDQPPVVAHNGDTRPLGFAIYDLTVDTSEPVRRSPPAPLRPRSHD